MSEKEELFPSNFFNQANSIPVLHNLMSEKGNGRLFHRHLRGLLALYNFNWKKPGSVVRKRVIDVNGNIELMLRQFSRSYNSTFTWTTALLTRLEDPAINCPIRRSTKLYDCIMSGILRAKASTNLKVILKITFHMKAIILKAKSSCFQVSPWECSNCSSPTNSTERIYVRFTLRGKSCYRTLLRKVLQLVI